MQHEFRSITFATHDDHRAHLAGRGTRRSWIRRATAFAAFVVGTRTADRNTLRYLWIEAGYSVAPNN
jgi:hypothetical protein